MRYYSTTMAAPITSPPPDEKIRDILQNVRTIALVGLSANPARDSNGVFSFLLHHGYRAVGINPGLAGQTIHGAPVYARLADMPLAIDMVDIFRNSEAAGGVVDEALALSPLPKVIWMQLGVINEAAAQKARARGVDVVMDRCPKIEIGRLRI
jgi:predicted CoA-binding protein